MQTSLMRARAQPPQSLRCTKAKHEASVMPLEDAPGVPVLPGVADLLHGADKPTPGVLEPRSNCSW